MDAQSKKKLKLYVHDGFSLTKLNETEPLAFISIGDTKYIPICANISNDA